MRRIGLISDTHGYIHPRVFDFFRECDEIWHAGDIGSMQAADLLAGFKPLRAVHGNIDDHQIRSHYPEKLYFKTEEVSVFMTHIGGYPGNYAKGIKNELIAHRPKLFVCGHSHILKVIPDHKLHLLHVNPGAAGIQGFHKKITFVRFQIIGESIQEMEIMDIDRDKMI